MIYTVLVGVADDYAMESFDKNKSLSTSYIEGMCRYLIGFVGKNITKILRKSSLFIGKKCYLHKNFVKIWCGAGCKRLNI